MQPACSRGDGRKALEVQAGKVRAGPKPMAGRVDVRSSVAAQVQGGDEKLGLPAVPRRAVVIEDLHARRWQRTVGFHALLDRVAQVDEAAHRCNRIWVAVLDGEPIGYSYLAYRPSLVETGFPGVVREHRSKSLARALKLETLFQALDLGVTVVETDNDSENAPILHITRSSVTGRCLAGSSSTGS